MSWQYATRKKCYYYSQYKCVLVLLLHSSEQLKDEYTQGPAVCPKVVALVHDHLGGHILRGPAERPGFLPQADPLGEAKVCLINMATKECKCRHLPQ